jgi:DNA-binding NtrC family response regulator
MPLVKYFLEKYAHENRTPVPKITKEAMTALIDYSFPGNIRELGNIIEQAIILANNHNICTSDLPEQVLQGCIPMRGEDQKYNISTENLLDVLNRAVICKTSGPSKLWHKSLKCITIEKLHKFLIKTNGNWFRRKDLAKFLKKDSKSDKNKYKTAGSYLKILKENHICVHNDKKANQSRYKLSEVFITNSYLKTLTKNHIKVHNDN